MRNLQSQHLSPVNFLLGKSVEIKSPAVPNIFLTVVEPIRVITVCCGCPVHSSPGHTASGGAAPLVKQWQACNGYFLTGKCLSRVTIQKPCVSEILPAPTRVHAKSFLFISASLKIKSQETIKEKKMSIRYLFLISHFCGEDCVKCYFMTEVRKIIYLQHINPR